MRILSALKTCSINEMAKYLVKQTLWRNLVIGEAIQRRNDVIAESSISRRKLIYVEKRRCGGWRIG
jgi:hypothetical protein